MEEPESIEVTEEQLRELDDRYTPFRPFADWSTDVPRGDLWDQSVLAVDETRAAVDPKDLTRAIDIVNRAAALDSGAIEGLYIVDRGFTITVATQAAAWQVELDERGENARALFEAQLAAYELVLDVATVNRPVTEVWIRNLHEVLAAPQDTYVVITPAGRQEHPLPKGVYKEHPNHVRLPDGGFHSYAPVDITGEEVHRLVAEISTDEFATAHPVIQAAYVHHAFTAIHPFADGNGRVARAVASVYLYRAASIPLLLFADRRFEYFDALRGADLGEVRPLVRFFFDAALSAIALVVEQARTARAPDAAEALTHLRRLLIAQGELTHQELDGVANEFASALHTTFSNAVAGLDLPPGVTANVQGDQGTPGMPPGFRQTLATPSRFITVHMGSTAPANARVQQRFAVVVSLARDESETFLLLGTDSGEELRFALRDVHPARTAATEQRLTSLADRVLGTLSAQLASEAAESLRKAGYSA